VTVPILPGAPNPGEVDIALTITPINPPPHLSISTPMVLRIFTSDAALPPKVVSAQGTPQGIVLTFSKPMDPAGASYVNNYAVQAWSVKTHTTNSLLANAAFYGTLGVVQLGPAASTSSVQAVRLKSAQYDSATHTVTLVPQRRLTYKGQLTVTQGPAARSAAGPRHHPHPSPRLTDVEGNPIDPEYNRPGTFSISVTRPRS
jgi:hypothetical protein